MDHTVVRVGANVVCTAIDTPLCISGCGRVTVLALATSLLCQNSGLLEESPMSSSVSIDIALVDDDWQRLPPFGWVLILDPSQTMYLTPLPLCCPARQLCVGELPCRLIETEYKERTRAESTRNKSSLELSSLGIQRCPPYPLRQLSGYLGLDRRISMSRYSFCKLAIILHINTIHVCCTYN